MPEIVWRDDGLNTDGMLPTLTTVSTHTQDLVGGPSAFYVLIIAHVKGHHGRGFMPQLYGIFDGRHAYNGGIHYGTDQNAYDAAKESGRHMLKHRSELAQADIDRYR